MDATTALVFSVGIALVLGWVAGGMLGRGESPAVAFVVLLVGMSAGAWFPALVGA